MVEVCEIIDSLFHLFIKYLKSKDIAIPKVGDGKIFMMLILRMIASSL